jgi:DNA-binding GntR family transcriptional regulator
MGATPHTPDPLPRRSLPQQVAERLRAEISCGQLPPGSVLRQAALAERFGVSVIPLREALRQLEGEGLVRSEPHYGAVVTDLSAEDVAEIVRITVALEGLAYPRALPRVGDSDLAAAEECLRALRDERDPLAFAGLAWRLRAALLAPAESPRLLCMLATLHAQSLRYYGLFLSNEVSRAWSLRYFERLVALVRARDLDGLLVHVEQGRQRGLELVRPLLATREAPRP